MWCKKRRNIVYNPLLMSQKPCQFSAVKPKMTDVAQMVDLINSDPAHLIPRTKQEIVKLRLSAWRVVKIDDKVVGCGCLEKYSERIAEIRSFIVMSEYRSMGVGTVILENLLKCAKDVQLVFVVTSRPSFFQNNSFGFFSQEKYILFHEKKHNQSNKKLLKMG